jgi:hypothetical protein
MSKINDVWAGGEPSDTTITDTDSSATYDYFGSAPRGSGTNDATWHITRTTKVSPHVTESASNAYDQVFDDILTIVTWG